jgi:hypothetical protein
MMGSGTNLMKRPALLWAPGVGLGAVELGFLLPHLAGVIVEEVAVAVGLLVVTGRTRAATAACPKCGAVSGRGHSRYWRTLADAAN